MAWKIERWLTDVWPGDTEGHRLYSQYKNLGARELVIVACASLDVGLVELLALRLRDDPKEVEEFLGASEDGRAPAGSLGARIQLAYLLGLIGERDLKRFRALKKLRNVLAHRVKVDLTSARCQGCIDPIRDHWHAMLGDMSGDTELLATILDGSRTNATRAMELLSLEVFSANHQLRAVHDRVVRLATL